MKAYPGLREESDLGFETVGESEEQKSHAEVGDGCGGGDETHAGAGGAVLAWSKGHDTADREQQNSA